MNCEKNVSMLSVAFPYDPTQVPCPVDYCLRLCEAVNAEFCGIGVFCRDGMRQVRKILTDITRGEGKSGDIALLQEICGAIGKLADCSLSRDAAGEVLRLIGEYREVFESHISRRRCPAVVCSRLTFVYVDPAKCTGCGACIPVCPEAAIEGGDGLIHVIAPELCTGCGKCMAVCPAGAVKRMDVAGIKPKLPAFPEPVGSYKASPEPGKGLRKGLRKK